MRNAVKASPPKQQESVFPADGTIVPDIGKEGNELGPDGGYFARPVEPQRRSVLLLQIHALHPLPVAGPEIILLFRRAVDQAEKPGPVLLGRPRRMAGGTLQLLHMGSNRVFDNLRIGSVALSAGF